ncbi:N-acylneuraminate cytidylyltransferase [Pedobacter sp. AK017]|uniref:pseudaminic acid cytidylyltransferase n=1 Tax=Pedobacter sp. AK017 TaxID=2723073 RepID=UPI001618463C|nr:pseudaminic acid cytidylyltransferase [Pedobacter sp. AK017]MBB5439638.1 N-acylneuraminate cytidylyltransferase [Pedobacter sp. AK017]
MKNIAIIPARGGSKRILRKNIKDFYGKPILSYSIEAAKKSELFEDVIVSTDDEEIAEIAIKYGASVPFLRSSKNADDFATTASVLEEVLITLSGLSREYDNACCIYSTAPLISIEKLKLGYTCLLEQQRHTVFPVLKFNNSIWRGFEYGENGVTSMIWPEYENTRSQDMKDVYHDAGQWYWVNCIRFRNEVRFFTKNTSSILLEEFEAQDIDNAEDWFLAEKKFEYKNKLKKIT